MIIKLITSLLLPAAIIALEAHGAEIVNAEPPAATTETALAATRARLQKMLGTDEVVFIKRFTYTSNHYYTEYQNMQ